MYLWAFKAEKGSEFTAAHLPGPYSHQGLAYNNWSFMFWERDFILHCGWYFLKEAQNYYQIVEKLVDYEWKYIKSVHTAVAGNLKHMSLWDAYS